MRRSGISMSPTLMLDSGKRVLASSLWKRLEFLKKWVSCTFPDQPTKMSKNWL